MGKPGHQDIPVPRAIIIATYLMLLEFTLLLFPVDTAAWLGMEDGPVKNVGALSFLLAGIVFLVTAYRPSGIHRQSGAGRLESPLALLALGVLCLVCFGEEISWGQRLFDYSVPAWLADFNRQGEWNLHNLAWFHAKTTVFQLALCTLVPVLAACSATFRTWGARIGLPIVPWWIAGLMPAHILVTQALHTIVGWQPIAGDSQDGTQENVQAFIFLVVAVWACRRATATPSISAGDRQLNMVGP
jgi:hypothetical protein